jgi:predicted Zn-dependent peptidase
VNAFPSSPPEGGAPKPWNFPPTVIQDLPNGLRVAAIRVGSLPIAQVRWVFGTGRNHQTADKVGSGLLLQRVMRHGTESLGSRAFANALDRLGARMGGGVSIDTSIVSVAGLTHHIWEAVDLASDVALKPGLTDLAVAGEKIRCQQLHRHAWSRAESVVAMGLSARVYGRHPYGTPATTESGLSATGRGDLVALHRAIVDPQRGMVLVVGDVDPERVVRRLAERFSDVRGVGVSAPPPPPLPEPVRPSMVFVEQPHAEQTTIGLGMRGTRRNHPEHTQLRLANQIFGGGATSRLFECLRERHALTYGAYSSLDCGLHAGDITAAFSVAPQNTARAFGLAMEELTRMGNEPVAPTELQHAKRLLIGGFPQRASGLTGVASLTTAAWLHGLPEDVWSTLAARIDAVNEGEVASVANKRFQADRTAAVVCGPHSSLAGLESAAAAVGMAFERVSMDNLLSIRG